MNGTPSMSQFYDNEFVLLLLSMSVDKANVKGERGRVENWIWRINAAVGSTHTSNAFILPQLAAPKSIIKPSFSRVEADQQGSFASSLFFASLAPLSHPGDTRAPLEHHLLSGGGRGGYNPLRTFHFAAICFTFSWVFTQAQLCT